MNLTTDDDNGHILAVSAEEVDLAVREYASRSMKDHALIPIGTRIIASRPILVEMEDFSGERLDGFELVLRLRH